MAVIISGGKKRTRCFRDEFNFLSSMYPAAIHAGNHVFTSAEQAFQSRKTILPKERARIIAASVPRDAKAAGGMCSMRPDWELVKRVHMYRVTFNKFWQDPYLRERLLATGDMLLEEGNRWNDRVWGVDMDTREGGNLLGLILMKVRSELSKNSPSVPSLEPSYSRDYPVVSLTAEYDGKNQATAARALKRMLSLVPETGFHRPVLMTPGKSLLPIDGCLIRVIGEAEVFRKDAEPAVTPEERCGSFASLVCPVLDRAVSSAGGWKITGGSVGVFRETGFDAGREFSMDAERYFSLPDQLLDGFSIC